MIQWMVTPNFMVQWTPNSFLVSYVLDHPSSGVVSPEQAQCWRLFPHGLQCHNAIPNAQGKSEHSVLVIVIVKENIQWETVKLLFPVIKQIFYQSIYSISRRNGII